MSVELIDELEAGELSVEFEGQDPEELLEWALERFAPRIALSTAFQIDGVALIDMLYRLDPEISVFSVDTGRLPAETYDLIEQLRDRYPGLRLELLSPDAGQVQRLVGRHGPNLFKSSVENRLLCCNIRKVQPLTRHLAGLDAWITGLRRDQWASRTDIRKIEIDHDHGAIVKLNPLAEWTEEEVWDYVREEGVPTHPLYAKGYTSIGCAPCTRAIAPGEASRAGRWWWETNAPKECGIHCAIETGGMEHELHAILGEGVTMTTLSLAGEEREVALAEAQSVLAVAGDSGYRDELAFLIAGIEEGEVPAESEETLEQLVELGLQAGRIRALYGPGGEQAALRLYRRLPRGAELGASAREVSKALRALQGRELESVSVQALGPGAFTLSLTAGGTELTVRLDRQGARLASVGV